MMQVIKATDQHDYNLAQHFEECINFINEVIEEKKGRILVHCLAGQSRSATIIIAFLIKFKKMTFEEALKMVQEKRIYVNPNKGFRAQLLAFEESLKKKE